MGNYLKCNSVLKSSGTTDTLQNKTKKEKFNLYPVAFQKVISKIGLSLFLKLQITCRPLSWTICELLSLKDHAIVDCISLGSCIENFQAHLL